MSTGWSTSGERAALAGVRPACAAFVVVTGPLADLPTIAVHVALRDPAMAGARIMLTLDRFEIDHGFVVPRQIEATADADGLATLTVWPNARGSRASAYDVRIERDYEVLVKGTAVFPDAGDVDLDDYLQTPPYPPRDGYADALADAAEQAATVAAQQAAQDVVDVVKGAKGEPGDPGQIRFTGHGAPATIVGAAPSDTYLDMDTGLIYKLT